MKSERLTLESEISSFANNLPHWAKYMAQKILLGAITDDDIDTSYSYLLEELKLKETTEITETQISNISINSKNHKPDLLLTKLEKVEGVNALTEGQTIKFNPKLTVIYGENGSGKSGYVRLFKKAFYSKVPEEILPNIHVKDDHKPVSAKFTFISQDNDISLDYPANEGSAEFGQFSVFDGKGLFKQLSEKNEFEFRPAGLSFFAEYSDAIKKIEQKLNSEIVVKNTGHTLDDLLDLFNGESEIKSVIQDISATTNIDDLKKYTPFTSEDKTKKTKVQQQYDDLVLASKARDKEILKLENVKKLLTNNKNVLEKLNQHFSTEALKKVRKAICDCKEKETIARNEGIENFKTDKIEGIGTTEWKNFILSADSFAKNQKFKATYPETEDNCLLCHQPLSSDAKNLITNYWIFIKSTAEESASKAKENLNKIKHIFEKLNFDVFPDENTLTVWLTEKDSQYLDSLKQVLSKQKALSEKIISDIQNKTENDRTEIKNNFNKHASIETTIDNEIKLLNSDERSKKLEKLLKEKTFFEHKEKFNNHFSKFETYVNKLIWINKAEKANFAKSKITNAEKALSKRYFNQKYIDTFENECQKLNGNFGIEINHTGTNGKSFRQLKLRGRNPNAILSEGEQKVIAIADFIAEMQLSEVNRGIIFDDPVTSLDEIRKSVIAKRLVQKASSKQTIVFTHDLVFVSSLIGFCADLKLSYDCHWIENQNGKPGQVWLNNSPSYEKEYRNAESARKYYTEAKVDSCSPSSRESLLKSGFASLRTSYEVLVINDLFKNVVQRFNERVSIQSLSSVNFDANLRDELLDSFAKCCRYMEGHSHSDKYAYKKPETSDLHEEIERYEDIRRKIKNTIH